MPSSFNLRQISWLFSLVCALAVWFIAAIRQLRTLAIDTVKFSTGSQFVYMVIIHVVTLYLGSGCGSIKVKKQMYAVELHVSIQVLKQLEQSPTTENLRNIDVHAKKCRPIIASFQINGCVILGQFIWRNS